MQRKITATIPAMCLLATFSQIAPAHVNIAPDNAFSLGDEPRQYLEGKSAYVSINLPHSCSDADRNEYPTTDVVLILPNSSGLPAEFYTSDRSGNTYGANAVMGTKARVSRNWKKVKVVKGPVDEFYSHGSKTEDTRAVKWLKGYVDNDHYDNLEIKTRFPKIDPESCIGTLRVELPAIQYCKKGYVTAWIGTTGSAKFPADSDKLRLEETYEPYLNVVRDVANNPYPESCPTDADGNVIPTTATASDIDAYASRHRGRRGRDD